MKARDLDPRLSSLGDLDFTRIDNLSGECQPGSLFVAVPGTQSDGTQYIPDALARGAVAVVYVWGVRERGCRIVWGGWV